MARRRGEPGRLPAPRHQSSAEGRFVGDLVGARIHRRPFLVVALLLVVAVLVGLAAGPAGLPLSTVVRALFGHLPLLHFHSGVSTQDDAVVWPIRLPRVVLGGLAGCMLAVVACGPADVLRPQLLTRRFGVGVRVLGPPDGQLVVVSLRESPAGSAVLSELLDPEWDPGDDEPDRVSRAGEFTVQRPQ